MAAVSVGRGSHPASSAYRGQALTRSSDPPTETQRLEKQMDIDYAKKALKMLKKAMTRLRTHNWDKGRGQPGWVYVEKLEDAPPHRTVSAGETFNANVENVGPAKTEVDMVMNWNRDFKTTGGESCTGSSTSRRIAFTCHERDVKRMQDQVNDHHSKRAERQSGKTVQKYEVTDEHDASYGASSSVTDMWSHRLRCGRAPAVGPENDP